MSEYTNIDRDLLKTENRFACLFMVLACLSLAHFVHNGWFGFSGSQESQVTGNPMYYLFAPVIGTQHAPEAYRVAIPALGRFMVETLHMRNAAWVAAGLDFVFGFLAMYMFYRVAVTNMSLAQLRSRERLLVSILFLAFVQFPINWVVPWQRPETLPTALFLAVAVFCIERTAQNKIWSWLLFVAALCQSFVRADVAFVFGLAVLLMSFNGKILEQFGSRSSNALRGFCITCIAGSTQIYLQFVRFPHLTYWPVETLWQIRGNLHIHNLSVCAIALLPFILLAPFVLATRTSLRGINAIIAAASILYFVLWFMVGSIGEVRIYVPFMMALCVVLAKLSARFLMQGGVGTAHQTT